MKKIKILQVAVLTLLITGFTHAQENSEGPITHEPEKPIGTTKIDEFGRVGDCELGARIQNFYVELANNSDSTGYMVLYKGADVLPSGYDVERSPMGNRIRDQITFLRLDDSRVVLIEGGFRKSLATELWIVPLGFPPPEPTDIVEKPTMPTGKTFLWGKSWVSDGNEDTSDDEFILPSVRAKQDEEARLFELENAAQMDEQSDEAKVEEGMDVRSDEVLTGDEESAEEEHLTPEEIKERRFSWADVRFGEEIARREKSTGVVIFYADDQYYDIQKIEKFIHDGRDIIAKKAKIDPARISVKFGGFRNSIEAEYWIVPLKGKAPKPEPEERPTENSSSVQ